ncbi:vanin-like protein 2 [Nasonia vitripennis]|uniref:CN hydrolase domain-containing protein n=1 Tax=Nasonia vitripennis TaxID=7425 RepID=A0A7M7G4H5_NASVI|nr:vanin-like protein 2 [Nasonia vitripennis]
MFLTKNSTMLHNLLRVGVLLTLSKPSLRTSAANSPSYIGAVVEYHPVTDGDDGQTIAEANANNYRTIIKSASAYHADIIVFPEFGLTSLPKDGDAERQFNASAYRAYYREVASRIPGPNETVVLCDTDSKYAKSLQSISCAAREYRMYVAVNHHERVDCDPKKPNCAPDGFLLYNTNVVFDRSGRVAARYRQYNSLVDDGVNTTSQPEQSIFKTDFGVTFGQFVCVDLLFQKPATFFASNPNVTDVIFSTHWFNYPPFLESTQIQAAWAYAADVNFLASGYNDVLTASGGSGIYAGKSGPIKTYHSSQTSNALLVAEIPKLNRRQRIEDIHAGKSTIHKFRQAEVPTISGIPPKANLTTEFRDNLRPYTSALIQTGEASSHITTLCDRGLCCDFHVETSYDKEVAAKPGAKQYRYRVVVFNGVTNYVTYSGNQSTAGVEVCALVSCAGDSLEDCGKRYPEGTDVVSPTTLESLIITRRANRNAPTFYMPTTMERTNREPLSSSDFAYLASGQRNSSLLLMYLVRPRSDLETFGIYGRRFDKDGLPATKANGVGTVESTSAVLFCTMVVILGSWICQ